MSLQETNYASYDPEAQKALRKKKAIFLDDFEVRLRQNGINAKAINTDSDTKTLQIEASYPDYLLAKKIAKELGWEASKAL